MFQLISIAHRLQTVAYSDRVIVLDSGSVVEVKRLHRSSISANEMTQFDTPLVLFDNPRSAFRSLCDKAVSRSCSMRQAISADSDASVSADKICYGYRWTQSRPPRG